MIFSAIREILNKEIIEDINQDKCFALLKETDKNSKFKKVEIQGLHPDTVVFKLDVNKKEFSRKSSYLNNSLRGLHAGCDYVIVTKYNGKNIILLCELKSNDIHGAKNQLKYSTCFIDYMASLLKVHRNFDFYFKRHYVIFSTGRLKKQRTYKNGIKSEEFKGLKIKLAGNPGRINIAKIIN